MTGNKILIIEDNLLNLELATDLLEASGFVVSSAQTAEEGLRMAREILPDFVLMDFGLPSMDGLCATKDLKTNPATRHLTVVGLTAHAMKGDEESLCRRCDGYLTKPIDTRTFIEHNALHRVGKLASNNKQPTGEKKLCQMKSKYQPVPPDSVLSVCAGRG
jgi:CheY-like chemotaxis protein